jgi:hypothetical protein
MTTSVASVICPPNFKLSEWQRIRASWDKLPPPAKPAPPSAEELYLARYDGHSVGMFQREQRKSAGVETVQDVAFQQK